MSDESDEDNKDGVISVVYIDSLKLALELLDNAVVELNLDPTSCEKMVVLHDYEELKGKILLALIDKVTTTFVPRSSAVAIEIESLTKEELEQVNRLPQVGQVEEKSEPPPQQRDAPVEKEMSDEERLAKLMAESSFVHGDKPKRRKGKRSN